MVLEKLLPVYNATKIMLASGMESAKKIAKNLLGMKDDSQIIKLIKK